MAAKLSDLVDEISGANLHMNVPTQCVKDPQELEAGDSSPSHLPSWSPVWRLPSSCPNTKYCLEIQVTLMEELGAIPPPSYSWMAPLVEGMLHDARTGLTKVVVTGPCRAVLFYRRQSMGEGLMVDKARDASQELVHGWENWPTSPQTQWQFKRVKGPLLKPYWIIELRQGDQDVPVWIHWPNNPSGLIPLEVHLQRMHLGIVVLTTHHHPVGPPEAGNIIGDRETKGLNHLSSLHLPQTMGSRATGVHYWQCPRCHPDLTSQMDQEVPNEVDNIEKKYAWR